MIKILKTKRENGRSIEQEVLVYKPRLSRDMSLVIEAKARVAEAKEKPNGKKE
jgi:hypothetical protein